MMHRAKFTGETDRVEDGELEQLLRTYAGARLSPDQWASVRMRAAVIEHGRDARSTATPRSAWARLLRPAVFVGLVVVLAVGTGASAALAASPGGPLYDARLWVEGAILTVNGGSTTLRADQIAERIDELTTAVDDGNSNAADAAGNAYGAEVAAAAQAAQGRADLLVLRATIVNHLDRLQSMSHGSPKAQANLDKAIAKSVAALAEIDQKLAALASPAP
jgi:hypothetical protein